MLENRANPRRLVLNYSSFLPHRKCASTGKKKNSMKDQMEMPSVEEQVRVNDEMRKALHETKKVKPAQSAGTGPPSFFKIFGLALAVGISYGLFEKYSMSGTQSPTRQQPKSANVDMDPKVKEEITVIRRRPAELNK